jgi:tetratricopeptide (TPR) repeat protein
MKLDVDHELYPDGLFSLGKAYFKLNRLDEAVPYFQKAIDAGWEGSEVFATFARALSQLGKSLEETRSLYESAIAQDDENPWAKSWFALALSAAGEHATAEVFGRAAVAKPPNDRHAALLFNLALVLDSTGDPIKRKEAIDIAKQSAALASLRFKQPEQFLVEREAGRHV